MAKIIVATDAEYRLARNAERDRAIEQARTLAPTLGVELDAAEYCAKWLESPVFVAGSIGANDRTDSDEKRLATFTSKVQSLQKQRDDNAAKRGLPLGPR